MSTYKGLVAIIFCLVCVALAAEARPSKCGSYLIDNMALNWTCASNGMLFDSPRQMEYFTCITGIELTIADLRTCPGYFEKVNGQYF